MQKNKAGKWIVFAFEDEGGTNPGEPVTGDAANITANIRIDGGAANAVDDTNPTELEGGLYVFDITADESNGDSLALAPSSATSNVNVIGVPAATWTTPANFNVLGIEADGDLTKVNTVDGHTAQTGDSFARLGVAGAGLTDLGGMSTAMKNEVNAEADTALTDYDAPTKAEMDSAFTTTDALITSVDGVVNQIALDTGTTGVLLASGSVTASAIATDALDADALAADAAAEIADAVWDEILTGATHNIATSAGRRLREILEVQVYEGGHVWVDTVNGAAGTADYENGTVDNPSSNIADATTIATSVGLTRFRIAPNSSFTLAATYTGYAFIGDGIWTLALGGQQLNRVTILNAIVSGTCTTTDEPHFDCCEIGTATLPGAFVRNSRLTGTITLSAASDYHFEGCMSGVAGTGSPTIDFGAAVGNTNLNFRHYSGGIEIENMGQAGTDNMSLEGDGALTINANCTGGTIALRGNFKVTDNASGAVTIVRDDSAQNVRTEMDSNSTQLSAIASDTNELQTDWDDGGRLDLILDARASQTSLNLLNNISVADILTTAMTESYGSQGSEVSLAQSLYVIMQAVNDFSITGTTKTAKKIDGSTTAYTATLDDGTSPTSITRAT